MSSLRFALRRLRQDPAYAAAFVLTLGLGIGANAAIFSVVEGVLLRPLPFPEADRIVRLTQPQTAVSEAFGSFSFVEVDDYRRHARAVDQFVEYGDWQFSLVGAGEPALVHGGLVTSNYFEVLGLRAIEGRTLLPEDDGEGARPVAVLTHEFWRRAFGADPAAVGRTVELTGVPTTIVGVLGPGAHYAGSERADLYANYTTNAHYMSASMQGDREHRMTDVYARVRRGVTLAEARAEIDGLARRLRADFPDAYPEARGFDIRMTPWRDTLVADARSTLLILMGTVALVLVLAIANVGNLTLTSLVRRERELSIRAALGAQPRELRRHLLAEHAVLAAAGALAGVALAWLALQQLVAYTAQMTLRSTEVEINGVVLGYSLAVGLAAAMLFAWVPRLPGTAGLTASVMNGRATASRRHRHAQRLLVVGQIALAFVVLTAAGLLVRSLVNLGRVDAGFAHAGVVALKAPNYTRLPGAANRALFAELDARLRGMPGVVDVAIASTAPFDASPTFSWRWRTDGRLSEAQASEIAFTTISDRYLALLDIPVVSGRSFDSRDVAGGDPAIIINERFARLAFPGEPPVGRRLQWSFDGQQWGAWRTVIGIAGDTRERGPSRGVVPAVYESSTQGAAGPAVLIRAAGDGAAAAREAARLIHEQDPKRPVTEVRTLDDALALQIAPSRLNATLFGGFGVLSLAIAAMGVGAVLAFAVRQRTREFGIRRALGAPAWRILSGVVLEGLALAAVGIALGLAGALALVRLLDSLLFAIDSHDVATFASTAALVALAAAVASWLPARQASAVDPGVLLKAD